MVTGDVLNFTDSQRVSGLKINLVLIYMLLLLFFLSAAFLCVHLESRVEGNCVQKYARHGCWCM